jgi:hypothetical protein
MATVTFLMGPAKSGLSIENFSEVLDPAVKSSTGNKRET